MTLLLDTRHPFDAGLCGYSGPRNPRESPEGLIIESFRATATAPACVQLEGPEGMVELCGIAEIREAWKSLEQALKLYEKEPARG